MHISEIYKSIYKYYKDTTPLLVDCGRLCNGACCESDNNEETGMYLFPGEEFLFKDNPDFKIISSEFEYNGKYADILVCKGHCDRNLRPLSCRIFPVIPYVKGNDFRLIFDPRAKNLCPLVELEDFSQFDPLFIHKTEKVIKLLMNFSQTKLFLKGITDILDDLLRFGI